MNPYRILIVEDEAIVAMDIQDRLAGMGYELAGRAASGAQALTLAAEQRPDLVLMDIRLQGDMDGITAAGHIRQRFHVPVIFLTAYSEDTTLARAKLAEPFGYILKPFDDRELKSSIEIALYKHRADREIRRLTRLYDLLSEVNQAIVRNCSREELVPLVCRLVVERGQADLAWISWRDPATGVVKPLTHFGKAAELLSQADFCAEGRPATQDNPGAAVREDAPFVCNRCGGDPGGHPATAAPARFGFHSCGSFPLRFQGEVCGTLNLCVMEPGFFQDRELELLKEVAADLSLALDRIEEDAQRERVKAALRESEAKYRLVSENTADVIWLYDLETSRFTYVSPSVHRLCGVTPEQAQKRSMEDVLTPASMRVVGALLPARIAALEAGDEAARVQTHEVEQLRRDGSIVPTEVVTTLLQNEAGRVIRLIGVSRDISARRQAELALRQSQAQLAAIYDHAPIIMMLLDRHQQVRRMNRAALEFLKHPDGPAEGLRPGEVLGCLHALDDPRGCGHGPACAQCILRLTLLDTLTTGASHQRVEVKPSFVASQATRDLTMLASTARLSVEGEPMLLLCLEDITERRRLESQLRQAQKMEAVGQLAGGVAHDFNNILTGILIELGMLKDHPQFPGPLGQSIDELERAANRAAALTRQLLLFSRREVMQARPLNLNELLDNMLKMLRRLLGEQITVNFQSQEDLPQVEADTGMIEQVVMNLCVNARDAMPKGGRLTLAVKPAQLEAQEVARHPDARAGQYVCLSVEDTGCGMSEAVQARLFEPFFTTKEVGRGTGLGLATAFGIVQQHQGWIEVRSAVGQGSTFTVYLPACASRAGTSPITQGTEHVRGGQETILVVEDEPGVRQLARLVLQRQGYEVIEAANGLEALRLWAQHRERIELLFSDMVMPEGLTGQELAGRLRADKPGLKVILSSGYSAELIEGGGWKIQGAIYLPKPYSLTSLARTVRECLDQ